MNPYIVAAIVTGALTLLGGLLTVWLNDRAQFRQLVTSGQDKQIERLDKERDEIKASLGHAHRKLDLVLLEGRYKDDYINSLRSHIEQGKPPPPPPYPEALLRIATEGLPA